MPDRRILLAGAGVLGAALVAGVVIGPSDFLVPESSTQVDESFTPAEGAEVLKRGEFTGVEGHEVSGTVLLMRDDEGAYLRFENYRQTQGPDVFVYATPAPTPDTGDEIAEGTKIPIDGGADGGESTKVGNFTQRLPAGVDVGGIDGIGVWCDAFSVPFGYAELSSDTG